MPKKIIVHILAARPNFIKANPLIKEFKKEGYQNYIIHTNQHYDYKMSKIFFQDLDIPSPDVNLNIKTESHGKQTGDALIKIEEELIKINPVLVIVYGDVNSSLSGALAASKLHIPIAHIESGCRSFDKTMPEEINRILIDNISDFLFCTESSAFINLSKDKSTSGKIELVGNTAIDSLIQIEDSLKEISRDYYLATFHRPFNVDNKDRLNQILTKLNNFNHKVIIPAHPRLKKNIKSSYDNIEFIEPLGYLDFLSYIKSSKGVVSDSGGIQCECAKIKVPLLTLRPSTEHLVTLTYGNKLVDIDNLKYDNFNLTIDTSPSMIWDGNTSKRIVKYLKKYI